jgi:hypothetical protein
LVRKPAISAEYSKKNFTFWQPSSNASCSNIRKVRISLDNSFPQSGLYLSTENEKRNYICVIIQL